jgi:tetratricopeptide (TPR) repeat protein
VLESDPGDVTAQAALINLRGGGDAGQSESRLKTLLAGQPDSPALHFALGNLYARQGRWSEAQQAYFQAYALEPDNADYLFNVAVSLDHLRQNKLARSTTDGAERRRNAAAAPSTAMPPRNASLNCNREAPACAVPLCRLGRPPIMNAPVTAHSRPLGQILITKGILSEDQLRIACSSR